MAMINVNNADDIVGEGGGGLSVWSAPLYQKSGPTRQPAACPAALAAASLDCKAWDVASIHVKESTSK